jgi:ATP-binding cassette, subfamily B, bacterial
VSIDYFEEEEFSTQFNGKTLKRMLGLARPYWKSVLGFISAIATVSIVESVVTYLSKLIVDQGIANKDTAALINIGIVYVVITLVQAVGAFIFISLSGVLGERIRFDLSQKMFNHLQKLSLSYYSRTPVGWIMSRVTSDSGRVAELITWGMMDTIWAATNIITSMIFMIYINWHVALLVFLSLPILIVVSIEFRKRILKEFRKVRRLNSKITGAYNENITGVRVVKALVREEENLGEFKVLTHDMYQAGYRSAWLSALFLPSVQMISAVVIAAIVWYSGLQGKMGNMTIGSIQAFVAYVTSMLWPVQDLARVYAEMQRSIASAERIFSLIDAVPEITDRPDASDPGTIQGDIQFKNVSFAYEDKKPILKNFDLHIKRGEKIALVGSTGGGKTTIINLLCRFYEPVKGGIFIGGADYTTFPLHAIQSRIGMVLQTPHLFSGTIRQNIAYGNLEANEDEIVNAARLAGAHDFITRFEKGYEDEVGEGGNLLSVGQKQLISLARAILANPEIFIMDEATSSVDTLTEALIQKGMLEIMENRTSFIIAHRLSTIKRADRIIVIEHGRIEEMGSHNELLKNKGKYYQLYTKQFRHQMEQRYDPFQESPAENI